jgi:serine protease Do
MNKRPRATIVLALLFVLPAFSTWALAESVRVEALRELEAAAVAALEKAKPAFTFVKAPQGGSGVSGGSGFAISADGFILTNEHVVAGSREIWVFFCGGRAFRAQAVGHDAQGDLALLKVQSAEPLPFLELSDSDALKTGDRVLALGDPFLIGSEPIFLSQAPPDFEPSASMGIVSAVHRYSDTYNDAIQVDLAVNRGNSGGPLLTLDGKVVGINGKIETRFEVGINTGVGYAIPSNQIQRFLGPLRAAGGGSVLHGAIRGLNVAGRADEKLGLPVTGVEGDSPAARYGFRDGDLILSLGGLPVRTQSRFLGVLGTYPAGHEVEVRVQRGEQEVQLKALLVAAGSPYLGVRLEQLTGDAKGVRITTVEPNGPAQRAGLRAGDVILSLNGEEVVSTPDLARLVRSRSPGDEVTLKVERDGSAVDLKVVVGGR